MPPVGSRTTAGGHRCSSHTATTTTSATCSTSPIVTGPRYSPSTRSPPGSAARASKTSPGSTWGARCTAPGVAAATLVPAVHSSGITGDTGIVDGGSPGGWVLELSDGLKVYHAGDTMVFSDMALIGELWAPDIALLPIGGHYTMDPRQAGRAAQLIGARTVVPIHYGTLPHPHRHPGRTARRGGRRHRGGPARQLRPDEIGVRSDVAAGGTGRRARGGSLWPSSCPGGSGSIG